MAVPPTFPDEAVTPWLDMAGEGAVIITSNQRAMRFLLEQYTARSLSKGLSGWASPRILTWDAWLSELWRQVMLVDASAPVLISAAQENELWREAVTSFDRTTEWNEIALADLAQQAWHLLHQYADGLPALSRYALFRPDWQQFQKWATKFSTEIRRGAWLSRAQLARELESRLRSSQWQPPAQIIFWGFDDFPPAQQQLLTHIRESAEVQVVRPAAQSSGSGGHTLECASQQDEVHAAAVWARQRLQENSRATLAVITTKANNDRGLIYRTFTSEPAVGDFHFSLGYPLAHAPLVQTAFTLLRWIWQPLQPREISDLLLAPSLNRSRDSILQLAQFDCDVLLDRNATESSANLDRFIRWLQKELPRNPNPAAADLLARCQDVLRGTPRRDDQTADAWADSFREILSAFHFPAALANSSVDFQTVRRWEQLLDDFSALSFNGRKFSAPAALDRLVRMAHDAIFQPESTSANIEILGPLEAAGSLYDGIFFIGCTEDRWPIPVSPNPLLSVELQQATAMPGAIRGANVAAAKKMTERLLQSTPEITFSFPTRDAEGEVRASSVLESLHIPPLVQTNGFAAKATHPEPQLILADDLHPLPWEFARGHLSTAALRSQAACPFQAFSNQRLRTRDLSQPEDGLDAMQRGNLVHALLHAVWLDGPRLSGLKTSSRLQEIVAAGELQSFVEERAAAVIKAQEHSPWEREFLLAERERLVSLVCRWLTDVELQRAPFEVVEAEAKRDIAIDHFVQMRVKLDRLDRLVRTETSAAEQDEYVLIDYKTGIVDLKGWQPPRLDEPQLPIYADFALPAQPVAVAFGAVRTGKEMCLQGLTARHGIFQPVEASRRRPDTITLADMLGRWHDDIVNLAQEFAAGEARVSPKHGAETCKLCALQSLCRVAETGELLRDEEDSESHD